MKPDLFHFPKSFRGIVFIGMITIGVIPMLLLGLFSGGVLKRSAQKTIDTEIALTTALIQNRIDFMVRDVEAKIDHAAMHINRIMAMGSAAKLDTDHLTTQFGSWESFILIDPSGRVKDIFLPESIAYMRDDIVGADFSRQPYFETGLQSDRPAWSDAYFSPIQHKTAVAVTHPLDTGGMIVVTFTLKDLFDLIDLSPVNGDIAPVLLDDNNVIIYHTKKNVMDFRETLSHQIKQNRDSLNNRFQYRFRGNSYVGVIYPIPDTSWKLLLSINVELLKNQRYEVTTSFVISVIVGLVIALVLAFWFYRIVQRHLRNLNSRILKIKENSFRAEYTPDDHSGFEEFLALENAFSSMAKVLKKRGEELERQKLHFENLFNAGNDVIFLLDADLQHIIDVNLKATEVTGIDKDLLLNTSFPTLISPKDIRLLKNHQAMIEEKGHGIHDMRLRIAEGKEDYYELNSIRYHSANRNYVLCIARNISTRKRAERLLKKAKRQAEQSSKSKDEFLAMISHELRTPLNSIIGFASLLEVEVKDEEQREITTQIATSGHHLVRLFDDILDYAKLASGTIKILHEEVSIKDIFEKIEHTALLRIQKTGKAIEFHSEIAPECPEKVILDRLRVEQILTNITVNAVKFTESGTVELHVKILPATPQTEAKLQFSVRDTGIGMSRDELEKIWEPFHQNDSSYKRSHDGVGLGLAICRKLIEAMKGEISCQSKLKKGTVFTIELPFIPRE